MRFKLFHKKSQIEPHKETHGETHGEPKKKPKRKHIAYRISMSATRIVSLLAIISIAYFLTLISTSYKSFPFVTSEIQKRVSANLSKGSNIKIGQALLKFEHLHKIKIKFDDIRFISDDKKELILPKVETEFSIFNLILLDVIPSKIKIIAPEIDIDNTSGKPEIAVNGIDDEEILLRNNSFQSLSQMFSSLKEGKVFIKNISIIDAKINFKNASKTQTINLKESTISTSLAGGYLHLISKNKISFNPESPNLFINTNCQFEKSDGLKCDANFSNLVPDSIVFFDPKLEPLKEIVGQLDGNINFVIDDKYQFAASSFNVSSPSGSFNYPKFFSSRIEFQNLSASGKFDNVAKTVSLDNLNCNFGETKFAMSLSISDFMDKNLQKTAMQFKVSDVPMNSLSLLWPVFLNQNNVRDWVISHIKNGKVKDGYAKMVFASKNGVEHLQKIESELVFFGLDLQYDKSFPPISKIDGIANFNDKRMSIDISSGEVLNSKINLASVTIPDFNAHKTMLEINGKVFGAAEDSLKHIGYKTQFAKEIGKYFSGKAQTNLEIKLPIIDTLELKDVYIKVLSNIQSFNNDYIKDSGVIVSTAKEFGNNNFAIEVDLTAADLHLKQFDISKKSGVVSKMKTILSFDKSNNLYLKNFNWSQENQGLISKNMSGNLSLKTEPLKVLELNLKNHNFANSNFDLKYKLSPSTRFVRLKGKSLDLRTILADSENDNFKGIQHYQKNDIEIALNEIYLANDQKFKEVNIDLNCNGSSCQNGFIKAKLNAKQAVGLGISEAKDEKSSQIEGRISDISVLAKAFNLSNQIIGGNAKIKAQIDNDGKILGVVKIDSGFTILKNEVVEKIYNNNAFAKFKDKVLNSNEIDFNNLKLEFSLKDNVINIDTLIANSYVMGFTAKGKINLSTDETALKGLIVPGYALNKLFGIGQIPILGRIIVGEEGGGIFAIRYDYTKKIGDKKGDFSINPASAVIPGGIRNIFDLF